MVPFKFDGNTLPLTERIRDESCFIDFLLTDFISTQHMGISPMKIKFIVT